MRNDIKVYIDEFEKVNGLLQIRIAQILENKLLFEGLCDHIDGGVEDMNPSKIG